MSIWQERARILLSKLKVQLSDEQAESFYGDSRVKLIGAGEGSGKSFMGALYGLCRALSDAEDSGFSRPLLIWIVGADFEDARKEAEFLVGPDATWLDDLGILDRAASTISTHKDQKVILKTHIGITFETVSGHDPLKIGREQPDGIIGCEVSRWDPEVWNRCYGRLARKMAWGWFSGSFESSVGWFAQVWEDGQNENTLDIKSYTMPSWANRAIYPGGYDDPAIVQLRAQSSAARFMERYGGLPAPPSDNVFPEFRTRNHVTETAEYNTKYPVFLFIDPGTVVYCVLFAQFVGKEIHIVDEIYMGNASHDRVVRATQLTPAFAGVHAGDLHVMDIAGTQRQNGLNTAVWFWKQDTGLDLHTQRWSVDEEIEKIRSVLQSNPDTDLPYLRIHPRCRGLVAEFGGGLSPVSSGGRWIMRNGRPQSGAGTHDHACKALSYGLLAHFGMNRPTGRTLIESHENRDTGTSYLLSSWERAKKNAPVTRAKVSQWL